MARNSLKFIYGIGLASCFGLLWAGCSFPEHDFIPDDEFNQVGGKGGKGGSSGSSPGGTGGSSGSSGNNAGGTGGTEPEPPENCWDGIDNDGNGKTDCEDPYCQSQGSQCVVLPSGWEGPVALYDGAFSASPPACGGAYPITAENAFKDISVPATCAACSCQSPTGRSCSMPNMQLLDHADCERGPHVSGWTIPGNETDPDTQEIREALLAGNCVGLNLTTSDGDGGTPPPPASAVLESSSIASGGSCVPTSVNTNPLPLGWNNRARACGAPSTGLAAKGCSAETLCLPPPGKDFNRGTCVFKDGDHTCSGSFGQKFLYYRDAEDNRSCSDCGCGTPSNGVCEGSQFEIWESFGTGNNCPTGPAQATATDACMNVGGSLQKSFRYTAGTPTGGACPATGGEAQGTATPKDPITFCCAN